MGQCMGAAGNGYLCSITPSVYAKHYEQHLPDSMTGTDFLHKYQDHADPATQVGFAAKGLNLHLQPIGTQHASSSL